ncbi:MAG TPA: MerR family transcriptional regulator [Planctomycetota bacterium]|jgi:DNA-binding transcriptional MerR regulator|nr:MerR family transcriptional regulator [Planctomycetota bacterium]
MAAVEDQDPKDPTGLLRTADVLEKTGITHQVLYRYITLGLIEPARTTPTGVRYFHPNVLLIIETIRRITHEGGYSLRDLKDIFFKDDRVKKATSPSS